MALLVPYGRSTASVDATLTGAIGPFGFNLAGRRDDGVTGFGDLAPQFNLRWNAGVHNVMTYITGNVPVGRYDPTRLANLGLGYQALDGGIGYTYFNPQAGIEFSGVLGFTYNFKNEHTDYQSGTMMHFDWGASRFLSPQVQVGLVGYALQQLGCDSGRATGSGVSGRASSVSDRSSATSFRSTSCRVTSISKPIRNSPPNIDPRASTCG